MTNSSPVVRHCKMRSPVTRQDSHNHAAMLTCPERAVAFANCTRYFVPKDMDTFSNTSMMVCSSGLSALVLCLHRWYDGMHTSRTKLSKSAKVVCSQYVAWAAHMKGEAASQSRLEWWQHMRTYNMLCSPACYVGCTNVSSHRELDALLCSCNHHLQHNCTSFQCMRQPLHVSAIAHTPRGTTQRLRHAADEPLPVPALQSWKGP